jgi:predicted small integral membrane protein
MKSKTLLLIITLLISVTLSYLYSNIVFSCSPEKLKEFKKTIYLNRKRIKEDFQLHKDTYLLKIKTIAKEDQPKEFFINGFQVSPNTIRRDGEHEISYVYLPKHMIKEGKNSIIINFLKNQPKDAAISLSNYRKRINNDIYILFFDSPILPSANSSFRTALLAIILTFSLFGVMTYLLSRIISLSINRLFLYQVYSLSPFLVFLFFLRIEGILSRLYKVAIAPSYFWTLGLASFFVTEGCLVLKKLLQWYKLQRNGEKRISFVNPQLSEFILKVISWVETKEFADKSIILFMISLLTSAFFLVLHLSLIAEQFANIAYFSLVIGVIIKFIKFVRDEKNESYR